MAVSARFLADFTQFNTAVANADVKLKSFQTGAVGVEKQLSRMTDAFSGRKIIQDATLAAEAIERIGGISKLTQSELSRFGNIAQEATAKLKAMGHEVPERLQRLANAADFGEKKVGLLQRAAALAGPALAAMAGAFTIGAIVNAIKNTGEWAGRIDDLSKKMGISVEAVQRLDFAAKKGGSSIEAISGAMVFLSRQLVGGDGGTVKALEKVNLTIEQLRSMAPERAFAAITSAVAAMSDQNEKNAVTTALLGRGAADLIPIFGTLERDMAGAVVANRQMIEAGDRLGDSWDKLFGGGKALLAGVIVPMEPAITAAANAMAKFAQANLDTTDAMRRLREERQKTGRLKLGDPEEIIAAEVIKVQTERMLEGLKRAGLRVANPLAHLVTPESQAFIEQGLTKPVERAIARTNAAVEAAKKKTEQLATAMRDFGEAQFRSLMAVSGALIPGALPRGLQLENVLGPVSPGMLFGPGKGLSQVTPGGLPTSMQLENMLGPMAPNKMAGAFTQAFSQLPQVIMGALQGGGGLTKSIGGLFGGGLMQKAMQSGLGKSISGAFGGALSTVLPGLGSILGSLAGGLFDKLFGPSEKDKAKKALNDWVSQAFGTRSELQRRAAEAGVSLDKLFSTKRVKDFEKEAARVNEQLQRFAQEQAADAERLTKAIEKYGFTFEQLGPAFRQQRLHEQATELIEDWRVLVASGIDLTLVNEKMAKSINEYLRLALRTGMEVPRAFEPILQQMIEQGLLLDENGVAITDLGQLQIKWSETMTQGFDRVVQKLQELIDKLQATGKAIGDIPNKVEVEVEYREGRRPGPPGGPDGGDRRPVASISGGMLATVDGSISTSSQGAHITNPPPLDITLNIDGQTLARRLVRLTPDALALHGVH